MAADWNANDAQSILENKRHFDVCEGLELAGQDPILALQRKAVILKERASNLQQPQIVSVSQDVSSKRKKRKRKRPPQEYQLPDPIDMKDLKVLKMSKVRKLNERYKIYDRGRPSSDH